MNLVACFLGGGVAAYAGLMLKDVIEELLRRRKIRKDSAARREEFMARTLSRMSRKLSQPADNDGVNLMLIGNRTERTEAKVEAIQSSLEQTNQNLMTLTEKLVEVLQNKS